MTVTASYIVIDTGADRGFDVGINADGSIDDPEAADRLTADDARSLIDRLRAGGRKGHAVSADRYFGFEDDPADFEQDDDFNDAQDRRAYREDLNSRPRPSEY